MMVTVASLCPGCGRNVPLLSSSLPIVSVIIFLVLHEVIVSIFPVDGIIPRRRSERRDVSTHKSISRSEGFLLSGSPADIYGGTSSARHRFIDTSLRSSPKTRSLLDYSRTFVLTRRTIPLMSSSISSTTLKQLPLKSVVPWRSPSPLASIFQGAAVVLDEQPLTPPRETAKQQPQLQQKSPHAVFAQAPTSQVAGKGTAKGPVRRTAGGAQVHSPTDYSLELLKTDQSDFPPKTLLPLAREAAVSFASSVGERGDGFPGEKLRKATALSVEQPISFEKDVPLLSVRFARTTASPLDLVGAPAETQALRLRRIPGVGNSSHIDRYLRLGEHGKSVYSQIPYRQTGNRRIATTYHQTGNRRIASNHRGETKEAGDEADVSVLSESYSQLSRLEGEDDFVGGAVRSKVFKGSGRPPPGNVDGIAKEGENGRAALTQNLVQHQPGRHGVQEQKQQPRVDVGFRVSSFLGGSKASGKDDAADDDDDDDDDDNDKGDDDQKSHKESGINKPTPPATPPLQAPPPPPLPILPIPNPVQIAAGLVGGVTNAALKFLGLSK